MNLKKKLEENERDFKTRCESQIEKEGKNTIYRFEQNKDILLKEFKQYLNDIRKNNDKLRDRMFNLDITDLDETLDDGFF